MVGLGAEKGKGCRDRIRIEESQELVEDMGTDLDLGN